MKNPLTILFFALTISVSAQSPGDYATLRKGTGTGDVKSYHTPVANSLFSLNGSAAIVLLPQSTFAAAAHTHSFASLTSKPTTVGGYGITDFKALGDTYWSELLHTHVASDITDFNTAGDARWSLLAHTHISSHITDASTGGNTTADAGKVAKFNAEGQLHGSVENSSTAAVWGSSTGTGYAGLFSGSSSVAVSVLGGSGIGVETSSSGGLALSATNVAAGDIAHFSSLTGVGLEVNNDGSLSWTSGTGASATRTGLGLGSLSLLNDGGTLATGLSFPNAGLKVFDTDGNRLLTIAPGSNLTSVRTLTLTTGDADRTLELQANTTLNGGTHSGTNTGDQTITLTGGVTGSGVGSFAATVVTNANLTGVVTSTGNATAIADGALSIAKTSGLQTAITARHLVVPLTANAAITWTDMPAAATFLNGQSTRAVYKLDLTGYTECKIVVITAGVAAANTGRLAIKYKTTTYSTTVGDYSDIGTGATEVSASCTSTVSQTDSGWITMEAAARADVQVAIVGLGSNGTNDPVFGNIAIHFR